MNEGQEIASRYLFPASVLVALVNTLIIMPFDCVKTHLEKVDPEVGYRKAFQCIYEKGGFVGFFTGFRLRFALFFTNSLFAVNFLEKLE